MSKAADMAKVSARGGFHLLWGLVVSTVISSIGTIFIARILGSDLYGLYYIVLTVPNLLIVLRDWGINSAMVRYSAQFRAENRASEIRSIFMSGYIFEIIVGLALSIVCFALSGLIATIAYNRPAIAPLIQIAAFSILAHGLVTAASAAFTGMEKMELYSVILVIQAAIKTVIIVALVALGFGPSGATLGYTIGLAAAGIIGILLIWTLYRKLPKPTSIKLEIKAYTQTMLQYGIPISLAAIIAGFLAQFYAFLLPIHYSVDNTMIGNYGVAANFVVLIGFFATPITTVLFPAFSKLDYKKDKETLSNVFQFSIKYASILVVHVAALIMSLSGPAVSTLFGNTYNSAPLFLALLALAYTYSALGSLSLGSLINSQGQTTFNLYLTILQAAIGLPMGYILIMNYGVIGLIITSLVTGLPGIFISIFWIEKRYGLTINWSSSARILLSSAITAGLTYLIVTELSFSSWIRLVLGVIAFIIILIPAMLLSRAITRSDMNNLRDMTSGLGQLQRFLNPIFNLVEKLMDLFKI